jgi:hypothetical protein
MMLFKMTFMPTDAVKDGKTKNENIDWDIGQGAGPNTISLCRVHEHLAAVIVSRTFFVLS